jgi:Rrf2 family protein
MKLQKSTLLALYSVLEFACRPEEHVSAAEIAEKYGESAHHLAKVLSELVRAGIVESVRGVGGGYRFVGNARRLTLLNVVVLFEDPAQELPAPPEEAGAASDPLEHHRNALAHADAHGAQRVAATAGHVQLADRGGGQARPLAPSGWPSAMAPPQALTRASSSSSATPRSRSTARPWAAKASFSSITSICARLRPVSSSTLRTAGAGPKPMMRGATPAVAMPTTRARGVRPCGGGRLTGQQQRAAAVVHAAGVAGGHRAVGAHHALQLGQRLQAGLARVLVLADDHRVALLLTGWSPA